jgi:hypothetical protein
MIRAICTALLLVISGTLGSALAFEQLPFTCREPSKEITGAELQRECRKLNGVPRLRATIFCELPDHVWVHNDFWVCEDKTEAASGK